MRLRTVLVITVVLLMSACTTNGVETGTETTEAAGAPSGLDTIQLPDDADVIADVLAAMPEEIDGVPRETAQSNVVTYAGRERHLQLDVMEMASIREASGVPDMTVADFLSGMGEGGGIVGVESELDDSRSLVWQTGKQTGDVGPSEDMPDAPDIYIANWGQPDGEWVFTAIADSPEGRTEVVRAFVHAVRSTD